MPPIEKQCLGCGTTFVTVYPSHTVCTRSCRDRMPRAKPTHASERNREWATYPRRGRTIGLLTETEFNIMDAIFVLDGFAEKTSVSRATGMKEGTVVRALHRCKTLGLIKDFCAGHAQDSGSTVYFEATKLGKRLFDDASNELCV